jgi:hypothetical protein
MVASTVDNSTLTALSITNAVWSALSADYNTAGSMGNKLNSAASGGVDYAALGQAVWAVLVADADTAGTVGAALLAAAEKQDVPTSTRSTLADIFAAV